jgi:hypothetical protein
MFEMSPLSPLRPQARRISGTSIRSVSSPAALDGDRGGVRGCRSCGRACGRHVEHLAVHLDPRGHPRLVDQERELPD